MFERVAVRTGLLGLSVIMLIGGDHWVRGQSATPEQPRIPAYHTSPPDVSLPALLQGAKFRDNVTRNAYALAARIPDVLYQQPCFCYCDRSHGHKSLHDCFVSAHGASCNVCQREVFYAYEQSKQGRSPAYIRKGIMAGDWADLDISRYERKLPVK